MAVLYLLLASGGDDETGTPAGAAGQGAMA